MAKPLLRLAALVPPAAGSPTLNISTLTGGDSQVIGNVGAGFKLYVNQPTGDVIKYLGDRNFDWTPFAPPGGGAVPVFAAYAAANGAPTYAYNNQDVSTIGTSEATQGSVTNAGGWDQGTGGLLGWGIKATFDLIGQVHRKITVLGRGLGGVYTVSVAMGDNSVAPPAPIVINCSNGYNWAELHFEFEACAFRDTTVTVTITRTGVNTTVGDFGGGISPYVTYIVPDVLPVRPRAFNAWMASRNKGT